MHLGDIPEDVFDSTFYEYYLCVEMMYNVCATECICFAHTAFSSAACQFELFAECKNRVRRMQCNTCLSDHFYNLT